MYDKINNNTTFYLTERICVFLYASQKSDIKLPGCFITENNVYCAVRTASLNEI